MTSEYGRRPGQFAHERYLRGLRSYRRRMRGPLLVVLAAGFAPFLGIALIRGLDTWSVVAGMCLGAGFAMFLWARDDPPGHVAAWGLGATGERRTAKALRPLVREGWTVEHDVQRGRENFDHVLVGPPGVFLLETKMRAGTASLEEGVLTIRYPDDPHEVLTLPRLAARMRGRAKELRGTHRFEDGHRRWVAPVVVLWADFPQRCVEHEGVTYVHGEQLVSWLRSLSTPAVDETPRNA